MGRRLVGGVLVALGLMAASLAWVGYSASRTALDPGRSQAIADDLYNDREVRDQMRSSMASALEAALPEGVEVNRSELVAAADRALDDPAVEALLVGGLIRAHQRFLGEDPNPDEPIVIDGGAMAAASRDALVNLRPDLLNSVPVPPSVPVTLPVDRLPNAGGFRAWLNGFVAMLASIAVGLVVAAFVITNNRPRVLRRVGFWAIGASVFWLLMGVVLPELAHLLIPGQAAIFAAMLGVMAGGMLDPSLTALFAGVGAVVVSFIWMAIASLIGGGAAERTPRERTSRQRPARVQTVGTPRPVHTPPGQSAPPTAAPAHTDAYAPASRPASSTPGPRTPPQGTPAVGSDPRSAPAPTPTPARAPRWVEGVGYVDDDPDPTQAG